MCVVLTPLDAAGWRHPTITTYEKVLQRFSACFALFVSCFLRQIQGRRSLFLPGLVESQIAGISRTLQILLRSRRFFPKSV